MDSYGRAGFLRRSLRAACLFALIFGGLTGCSARVFRAETTLHEDGSLERAIYQPRDETDQKIIEDKRWQTVTYAGELPAIRWEHPIRELPIIPQTEKTPFVAAWGKFPSAADLPAHFVRDAPEGLPDGTLQREYTRTDLGLVVEHRWKETLADVVTLEDIHRARQEGGQLLLKIAADVFDEAYGEEHDASPLISWLKTDGLPWVEELMDVLIDHVLRHPRDRHSPAASSELELRLAAVCDRHGLKLTSKEGALLKEEDLASAVLQFAERKVRALIIRKDGKLASEAFFDELFREIGLRPTPELPEGEERQPGRLEVAFKAVLEEKYGGEEAFQDRIQLLTTRIAGVYQTEFLGPPRPFHYLMTVPGIIVETNGKLVADQEVEWSFDAEEAYPFGYTMEVRCLVPQLEAQQKLLGRTPLTDRKTIVEFTDIMVVNAEARTAIMTAIESKSLEPLTSLIEKVRPEGPSLNKSHVEKLGKLLLPARGSK